MDPQWRTENLVLELDAKGAVDLRHQPVPEMRLDLFRLFDPKELGKYYTEKEMARLDEPGEAAPLDFSTEDEST